jgi:hypothetical protein
MQIDKAAQRIAEGTVLAGIRDQLRAGVRDAGPGHATPRGTSPGAVIRPLLANLWCWREGAVGVMGIKPQGAEPGSAEEPSHGSLRVRILASPEFFEGEIRADPRGQAAR